MNYLELFQNLGFPIAVCVVLFTIVVYFFKKGIAMIESLMAQFETVRKSHDEYMQKINQTNSDIISKNSEAMIKNAEAFNRFSGLIIMMSKELKHQNETK